jgi:choline dehydrogenase-like flavoprotein
MVADRDGDVILIGTGAGGGTLAHRLAATGKQILIQELGDYSSRERDTWDSTAAFVRGKYRAPEFWCDKHVNQFPPEVNYYVGRNSQSRGAAFFHLCPEDEVDTSFFPSIGGEPPAHGHRTMGCGLAVSSPSSFGVTDSG